VRLASVAVAAVLLASAQACTRPQTISGTPKSRYHSLLETETRERRFIGVEKVPYITQVTRRTEALRRAYVEEYAGLYHLSPEAKEEMLRRELEEAGRFETFVVSHFASDREVSKLSRSPKAWRLVLAGDAADATGTDPEAVENLPGPRDPVFAFFYPHASPWSQNYAVRFPKIEAERLYLRMTGVHGDVVFEFKRTEGALRDAGTDR
jgi:hypothetical protein